MVERRKDKEEEGKRMIHNTAKPVHVADIAVVIAFRMPDSEVSIEQYAPGGTKAYRLPFNVITVIYKYHIPI